MRKIRKKKLIPKYSTAGVVTAAPPAPLKPSALQQIKAAAPTATDIKISQPTTGENTTGAAAGVNIPTGVSVASNAMLMNTLGIEDNSQAGVTLNSAAQGADIGGSIMPGWGHLVGGVVGGLIGSLLKGSVDPNTGEIQMGGFFGRSRKSLERESNRIKNTIASKTLTENLKMEYANNPNVEVQPNVLAAEGGIMRKPVDALVSKGELIYNPETKQLSKVPGSKGKPNKADDVYARLYEGDVVISNSPTMMMANGKTPALNLETLVNKKSKESEGTLKAREAIIKKVVNWQEANKTEPQLYAMYALGKDGVEEEPKKTSKWSDKAEWWTENVALPAIVNWFNRATYNPYGFAGNEFITAEDRITGRAISDAYQSYADPNLGTSIDSGFTYADWTKGGKTNTAINKAVEQSVKKQTSDLTQEPVSTAYSTTTPSEKPVTKPVYTSSSAATRINPYPYNKNMSEFAHWDKEKNDYTQEYKDWVNSLTEKDIKDIYNGVYGDMSTYLGKNKGYVPTLAEAKRLMTDRKYGDWHKMAAAVKEKMTEFTPDFSWWYEKDKLKPGEKVAIKHGDPIVIDEKVIEDPLPSKQKKSFDWNKFGDRLYEAASILTPLLDREKAEPVQYQTPIAKYRPTGINVDPQLRAIDESYAMARYNQANISPNTGAGMAYGLQAATNRAKQMSDIYNWQTNAQNELIGKNVDTFNQLSGDYAGIMNDVYDKAAANEAAAGNINRQNSSQAFKNIGQIRRDRKQYDRDLIKTEILKPMIEAVYENSDIVIPMLNKQIKKKSTKKSKGE